MLTAVIIASEIILLRNREYPALRKESTRKLGSRITSAMSQ